MIGEQHPLTEHKSYLCLFQVDGHRTWRQTNASTIEKIEHTLKTNLGKAKLTKKKFFEIDLNNGTFEEF